MLRTGPVVAEQQPVKQDMADQPPRWISLKLFHVCQTWMVCLSYHEFMKYIYETF